ncbi:MULTISPECIES: hypothetical protein [Sulfitobacter]|uniref:hypothetical protein n=1 Tax=Sulfitobacter TaxID=60136 RepID=UPI002941EF73|nr:hypothetical protein [Sulfitobacter dubius]WOI29814.1 hypothetical protein R1T39_03665 [Sulfitobacter dubius]
MGLQDPRKGFFLLTAKLHFSRLIAIQNLPVRRYYEAGSGVVSDEICHPGRARLIPGFGA